MNTQKQITAMVLLVFVLLGGCAAYTVYDQPRENSAAAAQQATLAERGARIFARYCRQCHGDMGQGRIGPALNRPQLRDPNSLAANTQWITDTITCGRIGAIMPPWAIAQGGALDDEQIRDLVTLITTNAGNGWQKAADFSAIENKTAEEPSIPDVLKGAVITGSTGVRVCGQLAATPAAEAASNAPPAGVSANAAWTQVTTDNKFSETNIVVPAGQPVSVDVQNKGAAIHNWDVLDQSGSATQKDSTGKPVITDVGGGSNLVPPGQQAKVTFTFNDPGVYNFRCDVHPTEMTGKLYVVSAASGGTSGATPTSSGAGQTPAANTQAGTSNAAPVAPTVPGQPLPANATAKAPNFGTGTNAGNSASTATPAR